MRLLLLGGTGQVGREFLSLDAPDGVEIFAPSRQDLDLTDSRAIARVIATGQWSVVVNAAGYTNVDRAENDQAAAFAANADAPSELGVETGRRGIPLIHISTDYVFDGLKNAPYVETDRTAPLNVYGHSKLAGERAVCASNSRHIVLRSSWVYSPHGHNFVKTILRLASERDQLTIVEDQRGCPTAANDIARACRDIALHCASKTAQVPYGIYHFAGEGATNWCEFAKTIVEMASTHLIRVPQIVPIQTIDYPTPAIRPFDTRLDCTAIVRNFGIKLRPWRDSLRETLGALLPSDGIP
jgi:dTDP-4-dehydrorhamnose reductase